MGISRVEDFLKNIVAASEPVDYCLKERIYLNENYSTISSVKTAYSAYRKAAKDSELSKKLLDICLDILRLSTEEMKIYKEDYQKKVIAEQDSLRTIYSYEDYIKTAVGLLDSGNYPDQVLGFAALTGRRVAEIACTANFDIANSSTLFFTGQLKTKDSKEDGGYNIPILTHAFLLIDKFEQFRKNYTKYLNETAKFHNNNSSLLSRHAKKHFSEFVDGDIKVKDLRSIYSTIACCTTKNNNSQTDQRYTAVILGHSYLDLNTCNSYFDFKLDGWSYGRN